MTTVPCNHEEFTSYVVVNRLLDDSEVLRGFAADIRIECAECGMPFEWVGFPMGLAPDHATTDVIGHELRTRITPCPIPERHKAHD